MHIALIYQAGDAYSSGYAALALRVLRDAGIRVTEFPLEDADNPTLLHQSLEQLCQSGLRVVISPLLSGAMGNVYQARSEVDVVSAHYFWIAPSSWAGYPGTGLDAITGCGPIMRSPPCRELSGISLLTIHLRACHARSTLGIQHGAPPNPLSEAVQQFTLQETNETFAFSATAYDAAQAVLRVRVLKRTPPIPKSH